MAATALAVLAGCGGGGGGGGGASSNVDSAWQLDVSPTTISVTAQTTGGAPSSQITASVEARTSAGTATQFHIEGTKTGDGIDSVTGSVSGSTVFFTVTFKAPAALGPGTYTDTITFKGCDDEACTRQVLNSPQTVTVTYQVTPPLPQVYSISPASTTAGAPDFTLTVSGSTFTQQSVVRWNDTPLPTTYLSDGQLTAQVPAADVASPGSYSVTVDNGGGALSQAMSFTVAALPALSLTAISPSEVTAGGPDFMLTALGTGFSATTQVSWNGTSLATTYLSSTAVRAKVTAAQAASVGTAVVTIADSARGGTAAFNLQIVAASVDAVGYQMNAAHTGAVTFRNVALPAASAWSVDLGGAPSYAVIAGGKVFVTAWINGNSQLFALNASTGASLWGPIVLPGNVNAAYDRGRVFVVSGVSIESQVITAIDAVTGSTVWSATVPGGWFPEPPVAARGVVYTTNGGAVTAFDETNGGILWQSGVGGTDGIVAVAADGLYGASPCTALDLDPLSGIQFWYHNSGCSGGGGATPVVASGLVYAPDSSAGASGTIFDATLGTVKGNYAASVIPAISTGTGFFLSNGTLQGLTIPNNMLLWSFAGDGQLSTAPVVVNNYVFVGSQSGNLYALDTTSGQQVWTKNLGAAIPASNEYGVALYTGLAAGDGFLVVPNGTKVTAFLLSSAP